MVGPSRVFETNPNVSWAFETHGHQGQDHPRVNVILGSNGSIVCQTFHVQPLSQFSMYCCR